MIILFGFLLTALLMWQMTQFSLQMGMSPVIISGLLQGFGLGCTFVPLNIIALSNLPRHMLTQGTAIRRLMRNLGGSIGISVLVATLAQNTQVVHSRLAEGLRPDNPLAQAPYLPAVQPDDSGRDRSAQCRGDAAGRHGRLHRRFQADDVDHARVGAAVARGAPPPAARGGRCHRGRRRLAALRVGRRGAPDRTCTGTTDRSVPKAEVNRFILRNQKEPRMRRHKFKAAADHDSLPVMVPRNDKAAVPISVERVRRLRKHLVVTLCSLRTTKNPEHSVSPLRPEPEGFAARVARTACSLCKGSCCKNGEDTAFLDEEATMARVRCARSALGVRAVRCVQQLLLWWTPGLHDRRRRCDADDDHRRRG
jgi:hypothetical protein